MGLEAPPPLCPSVEVNVAMASSPPALLWCPAKIRLRQGEQHDPSPQVKRLPRAPKGWEPPPAPQICCCSPSSADDVWHAGPDGGFAALRGCCVGMAPTKSPNPAKWSGEMGETLTKSFSSLTLKELQMEISSLHRLLRQTLEALAT